MGTAVFAGMIGVTFFGLIFTPVFYVVVRRLRSGCAATVPPMPRRRPRSRSDGRQLAAIGRSLPLRRRFDPFGHQLLQPPEIAVVDPEFLEMRDGVHEILGA